MFDDERDTPNREFETTIWSQVFRAQSSESDIRQQALGELVVRYQPALVAHLRRKRWVDEHRAHDLVQGFVADKLLDQRLMNHAEPSKGKFRSLLVRALENYSIDELRKDARHARQTELVTEPASSPGNDAFDIAWARSLLGEALDRMKTACFRKQQQTIWEVFECRLLNPTLQGVEPLSYNELVQRFGFTSPQQATNALLSAKRIFNRAFAHVARKYQAFDESPDELVQELLRTLRRSGPIDWLDIVAGDDTRESPPLWMLDKSSPPRLAAMIDLAPNAQSLWTDADHGACLEHLLEQPCATLARWSPLGNRVVAGTSADYTIGDLLADLHPPIELLKAAKTFGREQTRQVDSAIPRDVVSVIYIGSIVAARWRLAEVITTLSDDVLKWGIERTLEIEWLPPLIRNSLQSCRDELQ